jgi:transposase InsO family protein
LFEEFLDKVRVAGLKLKLTKAKHGRTEIAALGQMYGSGERWMAEKTIELINDYPTPTRGKQLERFLALGNYYSDYVDNYAGRVARLRVLARKRRWGKGDFAEGSVERSDFETIRAALVQRTKLALPDWSKTFIIKSDWSKEAMGAVLLQRDDSGRLRPLMFCSRKCTNAEASAAAPDGELLALVYAVRKFERYLGGNRFEAYVDQGSLGWVKDKALSSINNRRLQGAFAYLRQFVFDLFYRPSKDLQDADALSRIEHVPAAAAEEICERAASVFIVESDPPWESIVAVAGRMGVPMAPAVGSEQDTPRPAQVELGEVWGFDSTLKDMGSLQEGDEEVLAIRELMKGKRLKDLEVVPTARKALAEYLSRDPACAKFVEGKDGRLYHIDDRKGREIRQLVVPVACRGRLVVMKHAAQGHGAADEVKHKLQKHYFWPSMNADTKEWIDACGCKQKGAERKQKVGWWQSLKVMRPGQKVLFDIFGPLPTSQSGNVYVLVMMDVGSREVMLEALPTKEAHPIARKLFERVYLRGMTPQIWQSDMAQELSGKVMTELAGILGAEFRHSSPYHPQTNAHVERFNRTLATQLSLMIKRDDQTDWDQYLKFVEYAQLVGAKSALGRVSPLFLKGGWDALDPTDVAMGVWAVQTTDKELGEWVRDLQVARQIAMESQEQALLRQAKQEMQKARKKRDVDVGDSVWVMFPNVGIGKSKKLAFRMHGPYKLVRWLHGGRRVAVVAHVEEQRDEIVVHVDRMVRKKDVPKRLIDQWKPIKMVNAEPERRKVRIEQDQKKEQEAKAKQAKKAKAKLAPEVEKDQDKEFADPELRIDHIVRKVYVENKPRGKKKKHSGWQYKVRFIGYGPRSDEWYWEEDLMRTAPEMVEEFNQTWKEENTKTSK